MLKKLLKYELYAIGKFLTVFYLITLALALLTRLFFAVNNSTFLYIVAQIFSGALISMMINTLVNTLMRSWVRFRQNFYGDESYLTHTLPVTKHTLYLAKTLAALISMFVCVVFIAACIFIAYYTPENMQTLKSMLFSVQSAMNVPIGGIIVLVVVVFGLECLNLVLAGFFGMVLGHRKQNKKIGFSVLIGGIVYVGAQVVLLLAVLLVGAFDGSVMQLLASNQAPTTAALTVLLVVATVVYTLTMIALYIIGDKSFQKGVNVD